MPDGTYNALTRSGSVVEDPDHLVWLKGEDNDDQKLGGRMHGQGVKTVADYLLHRVKNVTLGELSDYYAEHGHPNVMFTDGDEVKEFAWDPDEGQYEEV